MSIKSTTLAMALCLALGCAVGRYSLPARETVKEVTKTATSTKRIDHSTITRGVDGVVVVKRDVVVDRDVDRTVEASKETVRDVGRWAVEGLAAVHLRGGGLVYGASVAYRLLGPVQISAFGLQDGTVGVGLGLRF